MATPSENVEATEKEETTGVVIRPDISKMEPGMSHRGGRTMHTPDAVGRGLVGMTIDEVKKTAAAVGVEDVNKYDHLNLGQVRMNLGNRIRGIVAKADREAEGDATPGSDKLEAALAKVRPAVEKRAAALKQKAEKAAKEKAEKAAKEKAAKEKAAVK